MHPPGHAKSWAWHPHSSFVISCTSPLLLRSTPVPPSSFPISSCLLLPPPSSIPPIIPPPALLRYPPPPFSSTPKLTALPPILRFSLAPPNVGWWGRESARGVILASAAFSLSRARHPLWLWYAAVAPQLATSSRIPISPSKNDSQTNSPDEGRVASRSGAKR